MFSASPVKQFKLGVAEIIIEFIADESSVLRVPDTHLPFLVKEGKPDLSIEVHYGNLPALRLEEKLFDCTEAGGLWTLYRSQGIYEITFTSPVAGPSPYQVVRVNADFTYGELYKRPDNNPRILYNSPKVSNDKLPSINPTHYPTDEVLIVNLLACGRGVNLHACGIDMASKGLLFSGVSGAGKSTIAELWKKKGDVSLLSDDRIIVRWAGERLWMYGTPWHGDARVSLPEKAPLEAILFLKQARENRMVPLSAAETATRLMVRCFPTFYLKQGMEYTLGFISEIAREIPCYELQFTPDQRAINEVLKYVGSQRVKNKQ